MSGEIKKPSYSKEMREVAKRDKRHLATIDVTGITFQGPVTDAERVTLIEMITKIMKRK